MFHVLQPITPCESQNTCNLYIVNVCKVKCKYEIKHISLKKRPAFRFDLIICVSPRRESPSNRTSGLKMYN